MKKKLGIIIPLLLMLVIGGFAAVYFTMPSDTVEDTDPQTPVSDQTTEGTQLSTDPVAENTDAETTAPGDEPPEEPEVTEDPAAPETCTEDLDITFTADRINSAIIKNNNMVYTSPCTKHGEVWEFTTKPNQLIIGYKISDDGSMASFTHEGVVYYTEMANLNPDVTTVTWKLGLGFNDVFTYLNESEEPIVAKLTKESMFYYTPDVTDTGDSLSALPKGHKVSVVAINEEFGVAMIEIGGFYVFTTTEALNMDDIKNRASAPSKGTEETKKEEESETPAGDGDGHGKPTGDTNSDSNNNTNNGSQDNNSGNSDEAEYPDGTGFGKAPEDGEWRDGSNDCAPGEGDGVGDSSCPGLNIGD